MVDFNWITCWEGAVFKCKTFPTNCTGYCRLTRPHTMLRMQGLRNIDVCKTFCITARLKYSFHEQTLFPSQWIVLLIARRMLPLYALKNNKLGFTETFTMVNVLNTRLYSFVCRPLFYMTVHRCSRSLSGDILFTCWPHFGLMHCGTFTFDTAGAHWRCWNQRVRRQRHPCKLKIYVRENGHGWRQK